MQNLKCESYDCKRRGEYSQCYLQKETCKDYTRMPHINFLELEAEIEQDIRQADILIHIQKEVK